MISQIFYFFKGYVLIEISGSFPEKFINIAMRKNIYLWEVKRVTDNAIQCKVSIKNFFKLISTGKKSNCVVKIVHKKGIIFIAKKYRKRTAFFIGTAIFLIILFILSRFLWQIEITGNSRNSDSEIISQLQEAGLKVGSLTSFIDEDKVAIKMEYINKNISWIGINILGSKAYINIVETKQIPEIVNKNIACNYVSTKNGVICLMRTKAGFPVAVVGDTVEKGQLLVSGVDDSPNASIRFVHADAEIKIKVWRDDDISVPLQKEIRTPTGNNKTRYKLIINGFAIPLGNIPFKDYDQKITDNLFLKIFNMQKCVYKEVNVKKEVLTELKAFEEGKKEILQKILNELDNGEEITESNFDYSVTDGCVNIQSTVTTIENTGEYVVIN